MKTKTTAAALDLARTTLGPTVSVDEDGGRVLVTASSSTALLAAYTVVRLAIESAGRSVRGIKCNGKLTWNPERSEKVRAGMSFALTDEESAAHVRGF